MNESIKQSLKIIAKRLNKTGIGYVIVGSTNLALQGISIEPHDIDIVTDKKGVKIIQKELKEFLVKPYHKRLTKINLKFGIKSYAYFSTFYINGIKIETITGMKIRNEHLNYTEADINHVSFEDMSLPCLSLEKIKRAYELGENTEKIKLIKNFQKKSQHLHINTKPII